jgi:SH3 domain-containing YSC84-like protein 1
MKRSILIIATAAMLAGTLFAAEDRDKELERVTSASKVIDEIQAAPDKGIPEEIMSSADCVAVIPSMLKGGFVFGANYGKGIATCRRGNAWSAPAPIRIEGGSWGLQIGGQAVDLVMLVMNQKGMNQLLQSKFKVGADVSAAAGPVGRHAEGTTDWKMRAQVLTYSRARGAFAGITLNGAVLKQDEDDTRALYGRMIPFATILSGSVPAPTGTQAFLANVARYFRVSKGAQAASATPQSTTGTGSRTGTTAPTSATTGGTSGTTSTAGDTSGNSPGSTSANTQAGAVGSRTESSTTAGQTSTSSEQTSSAGSADQPAASGTPSSADVQRNIQKALRDSPGLSAADVVVNVTDQSVELSGAVPTDGDKETIHRIAQQNAGSRQVIDSALQVK